MNETKQNEFYHKTSKLKVLKSKENLPVLFKIIPFFLLKDPDSEPDADL